jgi:hypothetical protein
MKPYLYILFITAAIISACDKNKNNSDNNNSNSVDSTNIQGYGILNKLPGIWNGPVTSSTALGSYPEWIVDFRPIATSQVSGKSELDTVNDIFMSFFIVKHEQQYKMAFRNGGGFTGFQRIAYAVLDSVNESANRSYYRFVDFKAGENRVYTEMIFSGDSLDMKVFTNKYGTLASPTIHMHWKPRLADATSTEAATTLFNFPQKKMQQDFSTTFNGLGESIFYNVAQDPYNEAAQPYLGKTTVTISIANNLTVDAAKKVFVIITTQPLFNGFTFNAANLKYRSRYVILAANDNHFTFTNMHPGTYYVYALYDKDGNQNFSSGDYTSSNFTNSFTLTDKGNATATVAINFQIP